MTEKEFRQRVMSLHRLMYGMALRMGMPPDDAADAVQDTQLKLWRLRHGIPDDPDELRLYCLKAFRNSCISWFRRQHPEESADSLSDTPSPSASDAEYRDTRAAIERLIDSLPKDSAQPLGSAASEASTTTRLPLPPASQKPMFANSSHEDEENYGSDGE